MFRLAFSKRIVPEPVDKQGVFDATQRPFLRMYRQTHDLLFMPGSSPCKLSWNSHGPVAILTVHESSGLEAIQQKCNL